MIDYRTARFNMVEAQLRTNKVTDERVLEAFLALPRERFVPASLRGIAYVDDDLPLGKGRFLAEPMVMGRLAQLAALGTEDRVLEIGAGTGYGSALLGRLAARVVALEAEPDLAAEARANLAAIGAENVTVFEGPLAEGCAGEAPFDAIAIFGAAAAIPEAVARQLAEGGRLVTVLKRGPGMGRGVLMTRIAGVLSQRPAFDAGTPLLPGFQPSPGFVF